MTSELNNYLQRIEDLRGQVRDLVADLPADALNWRPIEGDETNSLAILAAHITGAEHFWIAEVVGGRHPTRDRDAEFATQATDASELVHLLENTGAETREVFATLTEAHLDGTREARGRTIPVRWCILHVIDHTALHLGHIQLTYQLWMGGSGKPSPFWYERLS
ncbi:MAG: DinB family protein [Anaerolineae bacterium]